MRKTEYKKLLLTGGGTGGHLFPAIAAAQEFCKTYPNTDVLFVGTKRKMDSDTLARYGFRRTAISCYGLKGKNIKELLKALLILPISCLQSLWIILRFRPDLVIGVGGYVTGPVVAVARALRVPTLIHEQNSVPGLANRKLGRFAARICISLPGSKKYFQEEKVVCTGNPVRASLVEQGGGGAGTPKKDLTVLVLGGSLGATGLNKLVVAVFTGEYAGQLKNIHLIHQTGQSDATWVKTEYDLAGRGAVVEPFIQDMDSVYKQADFLISRAGATTLAELAVLGKPAILIPFPYAADNHQYKNAEYYTEGGGTLLFEEKTITAVELGDAVVELATNAEKRSTMSAAQFKLAQPYAAQEIVKVCQEIMEER